MSGLTPAQVAPWLVLLSQHLPRANEHGDISCSCGASLYVGHLPRLLHAQAERQVTAALTEAADAIEAKRNEHWQQHLREHPYADGTSCPRDYGQHDAFALSARIVRDRIPPPP